MKQTAQNKNKKINGFTFVETLVAIGVLSIFFAAIAIILQTILNTIGSSKVRLVASSLAQEKLETARNLPYTQVGTIGGIPDGSLIQQEIININGQDFTVKTSVIYIDDPFDGIAPSDSIPTDYKRIRVSVEWGGAFPSINPLVMLSDVAPKGLETIAGGGTLSILVFNALGEPVSNADVHIQADSTIPPVNINTQTDSFGRILLPGAPECVECYQITVTKTGFSTDKTYSNLEVTNPNKPHATILEGLVTEVSFAIDQLSTLTVTTTRSRENNYFPFQGVQFILQGSKIIGTNTLDEPVYKYQENFISGSQGKITISDLEWDTYTISLPIGSSIDFAGSNPINPFAVNPGTNLNHILVTTANSPNSLLVIVTDPATNLLADAVISIATDSTTATKSAGPVGFGDEGQAIFSHLTSTIYNVIVSLANYQEASASVNVSGDTLEKIILNPNP